MLNYYIKQAIKEALTAARKKETGLDASEQNSRIATTLYSALTMSITLSSMEEIDADMEREAIRLKEAADKKAAKDMEDPFADEEGAE